MLLGREQWRIHCLRLPCRRGRRSGRGCGHNGLGILARVLLSCSFSLAFLSALVLLVVSMSSCSCCGFGLCRLGLQGLANDSGGLTVGGDSSLSLGSCGGRLLLRSCLEGCLLAGLSEDRALLIIINLLGRNLGSCLRREDGLLLLNLLG